MLEAQGTQMKKAPWRKKRKPVRIPPGANTFQRLILGQQTGVSEVLRYPIMTFKQLADAITSIDDKEIALAFKTEYIDFLKMNRGWDEDAFHTVDENIAFCFAKMSEAQIQMWRDLNVKPLMKHVRPSRY
jgi:hypothetical protein